MRIVVSCAPLYRCHADNKTCAILFNSLDTKESRAFCKTTGVRILGNASVTGQMAFEVVHM
jgi:hypothetical protein